MSSDAGPEAKRPESSRPRGLGLVALILFVVLLGVIALRHVFLGALFDQSFVERWCQDQARERFGPGVALLEDGVHFDWWPPAWQCRLTNGAELSF
jgi:hypothetical protein